MTTEDKMNNYKILKEKYIKQKNEVSNIDGGVKLGFGFKKKKSSSKANLLLGFDINATIVDYDSSHGDSNNFELTDQFKKVLDKLKNGTYANVPIVYYTFGPDAPLLVNKIKEHYNTTAANDSNERNIQYQTVMPTNKRIPIHCFHIGIDSDKSIYAIKRVISTDEYGYNNSFYIKNDKINPKANFQFVDCTEQTPENYKLHHIYKFNINTFKIFIDLIIQESDLILIANYDTIQIQIQTNNITLKGRRDNHKCKYLRSNKNILAFDDNLHDWDINIGEDKNQNIKVIHAISPRNNSDYVDILDKMKTSISSLLSKPKAKPKHQQLEPDNILKDITTLHYGYQY